MNELEILVEKPVFQALGWTLFHFLWQGALVGLAMLAANVALRRRTAEARYAAACIALVLLLALPLVTFCVLLGPANETATGALSAVESVDVLQQTGSKPDSLERNSASLVPDSSSSTPEGPGTLAALVSWARSRFASLLPWIISIWLIGVFGLSGRFIGGLVVAERLKRVDNGPIPPEWQERFSELAERLLVARPVRLCQSVLVRVPTVIGWLRPVVLLPASALSGLSRQQLEALLAHELAHIRRHDYLVNILQTAAETLLFYHPAVWWVSGQARIERENCCDDLAVRACGDVLIYARALTQLEVIRNSNPQMAMAATGGSLIRRIERLVGIKPPHGRHKFAPSLAALGVLVMLPILMAGAGGALTRRSALAGAAVYSNSSWSADDRDMTPGAVISDHTQAPASESGGLADKAQWRIESVPPTAPGHPGTSSTSMATPAGFASITQTQQSTHASYIDDLASAGLKNLTVEELIRLKNAGVTGDYIKSLRQAGLEDLSVSHLVELRLQGVTPQFIKEMGDSGYSKLSIRELIALKIQGITGEYVKSMVSLYTDLSLRSLIELKIQGVDQSFVRDMAGAGYDHLSARDAVSLRIQGVTPAYVQEMKSIGLDALSPRTLVNLKIAGVTADYARQMGSLGAEVKSAKDLISLKIAGVTPEYVKSMQNAGLGTLTMRDITSMSLQGVSPEYVKDMKALGFENLTSRQVVEMRVQGVNPQYVKELRSAGFSNLSAREIVEFKIFGVDAQFLKRIQEHGFKNLTTHQLIQLKAAGID